MRFEVLRTAEFDKWFCELPLKVKVIVEARLERLAEEGHWGFVNRFDNLIELKWTFGLRVYAAQINNTRVIALLGGNKNGQNKDIKKAKNILAEYANKA